MVTELWTPTGVTDYTVAPGGRNAQAHLEDMVASAVDRWLTEVRQKDHKPAPTPEQRKEIGRILNDIRVSRLKRKESSNGRIYYSGLGGEHNGRHYDSD